MLNSFKISPFGGDTPTLEAIISLKSVRFCCQIFWHKTHRYRVVRWHFTGSSNDQCCFQTGGGGGVTRDQLIVCTVHKKKTDSWVRLSSFFFTFITGMDLGELGLGLNWKTVNLKHAEFFQNFTFWRGYPYLRSHYFLKISPILLSDILT